MACLRLLTFLRLRPLLSAPDLRFFIARRTSLPADFEYFLAVENVLLCCTQQTQTRELGFWFRR
jgi:hypothetical protein